MVKRFGFKIKLIFFITVLVFPAFVFSDSQGQIQNFFIDPGYSLQDKEQAQATLQKVSQNSYFYLENEWYQNLTEEEKKTVTENLENLAKEFDQKIYPKLNATYGKEWSLGIDGDYRITILFHQMKEDARGYFNNGDEYPKIQNPKSNEREMIYLNTQNLFSPNAKSYLSHEFAHLITFNIKERLKGVSEEIWLNEARAEYAPTLLGYDDEYLGSNLQQRVSTFIAAQSNSLTDWQNQKNDYGIINIFTQYLVDHYGIDILVESLKSSKAGILSINEALKKANYPQDFSQIFTDWTITIYLNDCNFGEKYCYKNPNLKNLRITPSLIFFPPTYKTKFSLDYSTPQWSGNWYRIVGGEGKLEIIFNGDPRVNFKIPYVLCHDMQDCSIDLFNLDESQKGTVSFDRFGKEYTSLTLIPSIQTKLSGFDGQEPSFSFSISASMVNTTQEEKLIAELKAKIIELQNQIAQVQAKIDEILGKKSSCSSFEKDLYYGMKNNFEVSCLQEFLKSQGPEIYPEGLITSNFLSFTQAAVVRFQEKYSGEILKPIGLEKGTGYFGYLTRQIANKLIHK